jgi:hypothetical protein
MSYGPHEALGDITEIIEESWIEITSGQAELSHVRWVLAELLYAALAGVDKLPDDEEQSLAATILKCANPRR